MTNLSNEVQEALDHLWYTGNACQADGVTPQMFEDAKLALIAAIEAAQLQRLGTLSASEIVETAAQAICRSLTETRCSGTVEGPTCLKCSILAVRAALPVLQAPLRAEIELLRVAMESLNDDLTATRQLYADAIKNTETAYAHRATAEFRVQQLTEALGKYGAHSPRCAVIRPYSVKDHPWPCDCGFVALKPWTRSLYACLPLHSQRGQVGVSSAEVLLR